VVGREQLEKLVYAAVDEAVRSGRPAVPCIIDALEKVLQQPPVPAPPVWPGLEGEGLMRVAKAFRTAHEAADARGFSHDDSSRAGYTAAAAYLWRAMVASIPDDTDYPGGWILMGSASVQRTDLAALADPYDGGRK
jgi:hypothetical protein